MRKERYTKGHFKNKKNVEGGMELVSNSFASQLKDAYINDPGRVLPNAFWKTSNRLDQLECIINQSGNSEIGLQAWDKNGLHVFWNYSRDIQPDDVCKKVDFVTVSGVVDNITNPERLYRSCGFEGMMFGGC